MARQPERSGLGFRNFARSLCVGAILWMEISQIAIGKDTERIFGISELKVRQGYIELTRDTMAPDDLSLTLDITANVDAKGDEATRRIDVTVGESFTVSDGHHLATRYTLLGTKCGMASIEFLDQSAFPEFEDHSPTKRIAEFHDYRPASTEFQNRPTS
jgi:hypothetical protein